MSWHPEGEENPFDKDDVVLPTLEGVNSLGLTAGRPGVVTRDPRSPHVVTVRWEGEVAQMGYHVQFLAEADEATAARFREGELGDPGRVPTSAADVIVVAERDGAPDPDAAAPELEPADQLAARLARMRLWLGQHVHRTARGEGLDLTGAIGALEYADPAPIVVVRGAGVDDYLDVDALAGALCGLHVMLLVPKVEDVRLRFEALMGSIAATALYRKVGLRPLDISWTIGADHGGRIHVAPANVLSGLATLPVDKLVVAPGCNPYSVELAASKLDASRYGFKTIAGAPEAPVGG